MELLKNSLEKMIKIIKLTIIWFRNILLSKSHFRVSLLKRVYYAIFGGFIADQIVIYDLNRKNRKEYLSEFDWYKSRYINGKYNFLLNNKIVCSDLFKSDLYVPKIYCYKEKNKLFSNNNIKYFEDIIKLLKKEKKLIFKPICKGKGNDIYKIEYTNSKFYLNSDETEQNDIINLFKRKDNWFVSEYINQAKYLNDIFKYTSNTIRLITVRNPNSNKCEVLFAVQRIGVKNSIPVDNGSQGGLVAKIDLKTGQLSEAKSIQNTKVFVNHPDSNARIKGVKIPNWDKIKDKYVKTMNKYPYLQFVAWDILVTDDGDVLIEANTSSGVNIIQIWGAQRNKELGEFYKYYNIIKK